MKFGTYSWYICLVHMSKILYEWRDIYEGLQNKRKATACWLRSFSVRLSAITKNGL